MYFVISAGGTAGHINPALAVADELRSRGHRILFVGTSERIESELATDAGFDFRGLSLTGFDRARPWTMLTSIAKILRATGVCKRLFTDDRPDAVVGFGAYVSIPVCRAAFSMDIPVIVHEQNSIPGMANTYLCRHADVTALTYEESKEHLKPKHPAIVVGNPVRAQFETASRDAGRNAYHIPDSATLLCVCGGSLGARHLNQAMAAMKDTLLSIDDLYIIHSAGSRDGEALRETLSLSEEEAKRWQVFDYISDMDDVLAASDLVVSRSGASSLAEIMTVGVPAILVPYPYARSDHQTINARAVVDAGAAELVPDDEVEGEGFAALVVELIRDPERRATMHSACERFSGSNARNALTDIIISTAKDQPR